MLQVFLSIYGILENIRYQKSKIVYICSPTTCCCIATTSKDVKGHNTNNLLARKLRNPLITTLDLKKLIKGVYVYRDL